MRSGCSGRRGGGGRARTLHVGWVACSSPGVAAGAAAGCRSGGASDRGDSRRATFGSLLLTALVPGLASPPPSLRTGWTRFRAELEDRAPGAALRLLRRRMRPPPPPGLPASRPLGPPRGTRDPAGLEWQILKSEEVGDVPSQFHYTLLSALWLRIALLPNHCRPEIDSGCQRELEAQSKWQPGLEVVTAITSTAFNRCHPRR